MLFGLCWLLVVGNMCGEVMLKMVVFLLGGLDRFRLRVFWLLICVLIVVVSWFSMFLVFWIIGRCWVFWL